jgi:hypothetical protein
MPQVQNSFDADRNRDYFFTMPLLTMTSGEGKKFWRRFDAISPKRRAPEFSGCARGRHVHGGSSTRMTAASIRAR